jgi:hypothetical protein
MSRGKLCAQLVGFAVLLAALFALPQVAQAHSGHAHAMHVHTQTQATDVSAAADHAIEQQVEQSLTAASQSAPRHADGSPCTDRGCCAQGSCAACFSLVAPAPPLMLPPSLAAVIGLMANPLPSGIAGPSLQRPPRSFA